MSKTIYIGGRLESKEKGNVVAGANAILDDTKGKKQNVINKETDDELARLEQSKQDNLNFDNTPTEDSTNPVTSGGVYTAEKALSDAIEAILLLIPSAATALNKLVDTNTMNSSISTATATFRGTYNAVSDLGLTYQATHAQIEAALDALGLTADNNDFAFVQIPVSDQSQDIAKTERFKFNGTNWLYEYDLNTSGFTAAQWAAINSTITLALVQKLAALPTNAELLQALGLKQDVLTFDNAPTTDSNNPVKSGGIKNAIDTAVGDEATARENADTALYGLIGDEKTRAEGVEGGLDTRLGAVEGSVSTIQGVIPSEATTSNKLVDNLSMTTYIGTIIDNIDATFNVTSTDGHVTLAITQVNGVITSVQLTTSDIASAAALNLKASQADLTALVGRVTTAEGNITSLTGRMTTAESDIDQLLALYNALQQSAPQVIEPTDTWPVANPSTTVIYRVIDRVNTPPEYYSDYMWNGTSMVLMATYNNAVDTTPKKDSANLITSGGVFANIGAFDISEYHKSGSTLATYADLTAALAAIPSDYQKGGMSIKFVQSSDNKYVQYRLMADEWSTTVTDWQGVDTTIVAGSHNLVETSSVFNSKIETERELAGGGFADFSSMINHAMSTNGSTSSTSVYDVFFIKNNGFNYIYLKAACASPNLNAISFYSGDTVGSGYISGKAAELVTGGVEKITEYFVAVPSNCKTIAICNYKNGTLATPDAFVTKDYASLQNQVDKKTGLTEKSVTSTDYIKVLNQCVNQSGGTKVYGAFDTYKVFLDNVEKICVKVAGNSAADLAMVAFFSDHKITADSSASFISSTFIANNNGIHEYVVDVPSNAKVLMVSNCKGTLSEPVITLYYGQGSIKSEFEGFKAMVDSFFRTNPQKNLFNKVCIIDNYKAVASGQNWSIQKELGAKMAIVKVDDYGGRINVNGLEDTRTSRPVIFLDKDLTPVPNGGGYGVNSVLAIGAQNWFFRGENYIAFTLYTQADINNSNSSYGHVWTDNEIKQGYPDWIYDVSVNFVPSTLSTLPNFTVKDGEMVAGDTYDTAKHILNNEVVSHFSEKVLGTAKPFNFLFSTDSHIDINGASERNVKDMVELANSTAMLPYVDCIIQNGDICTPAWVNSKEMAVYGYERYYEAIKKSAIPFIQVSGNHDRHQETRTPYAAALTYDECVDYLKEYSLHTSDYLYDYQDFADKKVRIIKLDGFEYPLESLQKEYDGQTETVVKYPLTSYDCLVSQTQMQWLVNTLLSTPDDYTVVVVGHIHKDTPIVTYITEILNAAKQKLSGSTVFDYSGFNPPTGYSGFPYGSFTITYDFTGGNDIKIAALMLGHNHRDSYGLVNGINVFNTACQLMEDTAGHTKHRAAYTKYQNCFNAISLDLVNDKLILHRYGWGYPSGIPYEGVTEFSY